MGELRCLVQKTASIAGLVRTSLLPLADSIRRAFLYGSVAHGEEQAECDVDLMVIGDGPVVRIVSAVSPVHEKLGRKVNPPVFTAAEHDEGLAAEDHFLTQVEADPRINPIGGVVALGAWSESGLLTRHHAMPQAITKGGRHWLAENHPNLPP